ncbi:MAG: hypothetical protein AVDCRST_MAG93-3134, partial [uncultured Chloroflexia bacterium]
RRIRSERWQEPRSRNETAYQALKSELGQRVAARL